MAKRRRKKPNISKAVLEQAREGVLEQSEDREAPAAANHAAAEATAPRASRARRRRDLQATKLERRKDEGGLDAETVADLLANPTKEVSEAQLRADYGFVIKDLRNMGILAAALFVVLVAAALVIL